MPRFLLVLACAALILLPGCKKNSSPLSSFFGFGEDHAGEYLERADVLRIAQGLTSAPDQIPLQWENPDTGYQYSMLIQKTESAEETTTRDFTVLSIRTDRQAELLTLSAQSQSRGQWAIMALKPGVVVGHAARMELPSSPDPAGTLASKDEFPGFPIRDTP